MVIIVSVHNTEEEAIEMVEWLVEKTGKEYFIQKLTPQEKRQLAKQDPLLFFSFVFHERNVKLVSGGGYIVFTE